MTKLFERALEKRTLRKSIMEKWKNEWIGLILWHGGLLGLIIDETADGKNHSGRLQFKFIGRILKDQNVP